MIFFFPKNAIVFKYAFLDRTMDVNQLKNFVIEMYTKEHVMRMSVSGNELVETFSPYFGFTHQNALEFIDEWSESNSEILRAFASSYRSHYIDGKKTFTHESVTMDCSFLMTILFTVYH